MPTTHEIKKDRKHKIIKLDRKIVANCPNCKGQLFHILLDKPNFTSITGFQCLDCSEVIEIHLTGKLT